ncbi:MAG: CDP-alcohol phosphatidyltransferase family protein [Promethearchaeota archaeon]
MHKPFRLRPIFAPVVKKIAQAAIKVNITANNATLFMLISSINATVGLILFQDFLWFGIWVFITGLLDGVDGSIARLTQHSSRFGGFYDSFMDRVSESIIFLGLILYALMFAPDLGIILSILGFFGYLFSFLISYTRARAELELKNVNRTNSSPFSMNIGILARSERLFYIFLMSIAVFFTSDIIYLILLSLFVLLTGITFLDRLFTYKQYLTSLTSDSAIDS